jgi:O-antigen ligase
MYQKALQKNKKRDAVFILLCILWLFEAVKPGFIIPGLSSIRFLPTIFQLLLFGAWIFSSRKKLDNIQTKLFIGFVILMFISTIFARNNGIARQITLRFPLLLITYLAMISFADTFKKTKAVILIFLISSIVIGALGIINGGSVPNTPAFADQNDYALLMVILAPLAFFLAIGTLSNVWKCFYYLLSALFITGVIVSNSRGGFVGLAAVFFYSLILSPKKAYTLTACSIIIACMIFFAPKSYWREMGTILRGTEEATAASRLYFWEIAIREFKDHPLIGVGPVNYGVWFPDYVKPDDSHIRYVWNPRTSYGRVAHSIYFTILSELGLIGVLLFGGLIYTFEKECKKVRSLWKADNNNQALNEEIRQAYFLSLGINGGMIGYLVSGAFLSVLYYKWLFFLLTFIVGLSNAIYKTLPIQSQTPPS